MIRVLSVVVLALGVSVAFGGDAKADTWTCYALVNGSPTGGSVKIEASSKSEAATKGMVEYKRLGYTNVSGVDCK